MDVTLLDRVFRGDWNSVDVALKLFKTKSAMAEFRKEAEMLLYVFLSFSLLPAPSLTFPFPLLPLHSFHVVLAFLPFPHRFRAVSAHVLALRLRY